MLGTACLGHTPGRWQHPGCQGKSNAAVVVGRGGRVFEVLHVARVSTAAPRCPGLFISEERKGVLKAGYVCVCREVKLGTTEGGGGGAREGT